ncbi:MAG: hypothetical protein J6O51_01195 [Bacteroidales bacterium]|nr:hypothetical protein [Bacteroidales bacterium]
MRKLIVFGAMLAVAAGVWSCQEDIQPVNPAQTENSLILAKDGKTQFSIVYSSDKPNAAGLANFISSNTGVSIPVVRDNAGTSEYEIIVGKCGRQESYSVSDDLSGTFGYSIRVVGTKLVVAGSDATWIAFGIKALVSKLSSDCLDGQDLIVPKDLSLKQTSDDPQMIARLISQKCDFNIVAHQVLTHSPIGGLYVAQGAASDGKHFYIVMRNSADTKAIVYKYDMKTKALVGQSPDFNGGHCNDMTYDAVKNQVIVAHGQSQGKILTPIDADTMAVLPNITIPVGSGAITYNYSRLSYAISQGGSTFYVTDGDYKVKLSAGRTDSTGYTAQGMGSDDSYVYFPMSGSRDNVLVVYDWEGKHVTTLTVPVSLESESMFYAAGRYYVAFYAGSKAGASIFEIQPVYYYTYSK